MNHAFRMRYVAATLFVLIAALPYIAILRTARDRKEPVNGQAEILSIISPHRREEKLEYARGFKEWVERRYGRNVEIQWLDVGGTSKILKDLESRFETSPGAPGVDLLFGGGVAPYLTASERGWLDRVELPSEIMDAIPRTCAGSNVYDSDHRWFGVALTGFGIIYNKPILQKLGLKSPQNWDDLGRSEYFSWIASGDPRSSGVVHISYEIILQAYGFEKGWNLIARICANVRRFGESSATAPREVASGEVAAGMVADMTARSEIDAVGGDSLAFVLPSGTTIIGPDSVAAVRGGDKPELSRLFIEYVLSPEGQRILFQPVGVNGQQHALHRMPVLEASYCESGALDVNPYRLPQGLHYDDAKGSRRYNVLNDLMGVWLIDGQSELKLAWKNIIEKGCPADLVRQLCAPPVSESELTTLAEEWKDPRRKQEIMRKWGDEARGRYLRLSSEM